VDQALASIDFEDFEPDLIPSKQTQNVGSAVFRSLAKDTLFRVDLVTMKSDASMPLGLNSTFRIIGVVHGRVVIVATNGESVELTSGRFCLIPANIRTELWFEAGSETLMINPGTGQRP
jgi:hypothetical protein